MKPLRPEGQTCCRRDFLLSVGAAAGAMALSSCHWGPGQVWAPDARVMRRKQAQATVRAAFVYPPSEKLRAPGEWWSWPGRDFDAEGRQKEYTARLREIEQKVGIRILTDEKPLSDDAGVARFVSEVRQSKPDGLLLIPFFNRQFHFVDRILEKTDVPTIIYTCLGVKHGSVKHYQKPGVCMIQSLDNFAALEYGMRMIGTAKAMSQSRILSVAGSKSRDYRVTPLGTQVRVIPVQRFADEVDRTEATESVERLARSYMRNAKEIIEPAKPEIVTAAKVHFAIKRMLEAEQGDAIMMDCLRRGNYIPCMSFMTLRDQGIAAGCENDLNATLTLMLVQLLFDRPGFQHNPAFETEENHYFASHCTSASRLSGTSKPAEPYLLRDFAHVNDATCVPQVLWQEGREVTMAHFVSGAKPWMLVYSGKVVKSYAMPPVGGCRTNVEITINELDDAQDVKGHHNVLFYGNHARQLRQFGQLYGIDIVS